MHTTQDYLHPDINRLLQNFTKYVSKPLGFDKMYNEQVKKREVEYATSLPLQMTLYFNTYYSVCWAIGTCFIWPILISRNSVDDVWKILILFAFIMLVIFEMIRLYLGYIGNLCESVPELTGFWLLTIIIQTPLSIFLLAIVWIPIGSASFQIVYQIPMQFALQLIHCIFILAGGIFGIMALNVLARYQISRFHYKQFDSSKDTDPPKDMDWLFDLEKRNAFKPKSFQQEYSTYKKE